MMITKKKNVEQKTTEQIYKSFRKIAEWMQ